MERRTTQSPPEHATLREALWGGRRTQGAAQLYLPALRARFSRKDCARSTGVGPRRFCSKACAGADRTAVAKARHPAARSSRATLGVREQQAQPVDGHTGEPPPIAQLAKARGYVLALLRASAAGAPGRAGGGRLERGAGACLYLASRQVSSRPYACLHREREGGWRALADVRGRSGSDCGRQGRGRTLMPYARSKVRAI
jgi:hypothetical protein